MICVVLSNEILFDQRMTLFRKFQDGLRDLCSADISERIGDDVWHYPLTRSGSASLYNLYSTLSTKASQLASITFSLTPTVLQTS